MKVPLVVRGASRASQRGLLHLRSTLMGPNTSGESFLQARYRVASPHSTLMWLTSDKALIPTSIALAYKGQSCEREMHLEWMRGVEHSHPIFVAKGLMQTICVGLGSHQVLCSTELREELVLCAADGGAGTVLAVWRRCGCMLVTGAGTFQWRQWAGVVLERGPW